MPTATILCVDDEPTLLRLRQTVLSIAGYRVLTANDAESAMQLFTEYHVDLVILDHFLPDRTGQEVASEMKRLQPEVPIILYTGLPGAPADAGDADLRLAKGMLTPSEFLTAVSNLVSKAQAEPGLS